MWGRRAHAHLRGVRPAGVRPIVLSLLWLGSSRLERYQTFVWYTRGEGRKGLPAGETSALVRRKRQNRAVSDRHAVWSAPAMKTVALLAPFVVLGTFVGKRFATRLSEGRFRTAILMIVTLSGFYALWSAM